MDGNNTKEKIDNLIYSYTPDMSGLVEENRFLRETLENVKKELDKFKKTPLLLCELKEIMQDKAVVRLQNGNEFLVEISSEAKDLKPGDTVLSEQKNLTVIKKVTPTKSFNVEKFVILEKPKITWDEIGGLDQQEQEIKEVIELPLLKPELFKKVGIQPPKGILLHGPPGTGKTLLAKAVAASTHSSFIEIVGSELVQKFIGEGAKLVREVFELAREKAPSIIFIDEIDALASVRIEIGTSGEREVQRTFMQLLAEIDGFKSLDNVKIIGCTNRKDILDPAMIRPGRLDRLIFVDNPNDEGRKEIFKIHSRNMKLDRKVKIDDIVKKTKGFSGAEIKAVCTEAGYFAIRENRTKILARDFDRAVQKVLEQKEVQDQGNPAMFG
ncbi:AAA family ATPase [Candidatus Woesearchaeota archaeon]|nr:AAA family ATPase [Candidatus Woesearchaeota archaeon]